MPAQWTAEIIGKMHMGKVTIKQLAEKLDVTHEYAGMVLNGKRNPKGAEARFRAALEALIAKRGGQEEGGTTHGDG